MGKSISIVDVARHAGVSVSTVSLVMNNRPNVAPETAKAVWESVKALGYEPGGDGKKRGPKPGPRKKRQFRGMGLLMTGRPGGCLWSSHYLRALQGLQTELGKRHFNLILLQAADADEACEMLRRSQLDGLILFGSVHDDRLMHHLRRQVCVQVFGRLPEEGIWDLVSVDDAAIGRIAAQYLLRAGHDRPAFIGSREPMARDRGDGFRRCCEDAGKPARVIFEEDLVTYSEYRARVDRDRLREAVRELLGENNALPSGIFICSDLIAAAFYSVLYELGLQPDAGPDVVCCNGYFPHLLGVHPPPAVIDIHAEQVGRQAVDQVLWRAEHRNEPHGVRLVSPRLVRPEEHGAC
jgi:LacI family transcriptional regulator